MKCSFRLNSLPWGICIFFINESAPFINQVKALTSIECFGMLQTIIRAYFCAVLDFFFVWEYAIYNILVNKRNSIDAKAIYAFIQQKKIQERFSGRENLLCYCIYPYSTRIVSRLLFPFEHLHYDNLSPAARREIDANSTGWWLNPVSMRCQKICFANCLVAFHRFCR